MLNFAEVNEGKKTNIPHEITYPTFRVGQYLSCIFPRVAGSDAGYPGSGHRIPARVP